jgi:hypothetical protein
MVGSGSGIKHPGSATLGCINSFYFDASTYDEEKIRLNLEGKRKKTLSCRS